MRASFVIPLHGGLPLTRVCLASLRATIPRGLDHEFVLVDDASRDGTGDWLGGPEVAAAGARVLRNPENRGFAATCNRGAAATTGELLFFLNNDLVFLPGWYNPMASLAARDRTGIVGNIQVSAATGGLDHAGVFFDAKGKAVHLRVLPLVGRLRGWREVPAVTGACIALRRRVWEQIGGFDEGFSNGGEDIDLSFRALASGLRNIVSLRSVVRHHISAAPGRKRRDEENSRRLATRWRSTLTRLAARDWARQYLAARWQETWDSRDYPVFVAALAAQFGWPATRRLRMGVDGALDLEFSRWRFLLDGEAPGADPPQPSPPQPQPPVVL